MFKMEDMLKKENCYIRQNVKDWVDAIYVAVQPLVDQGYCEPRYIDGVIENTKTLGPYYVLCENLALIHASSAQGAIKTQLAVTVLKEPIKFKTDGYDVRVMVTLCAEDSESHLCAMQAIANIFGNPESIQQLLDVTSEEEIYDMFISASKA